MNTTLEALAEGVPLVAIPLGNDQPGVGARIAYRGAGVIIPHRKLGVRNLRAALAAVLQQEPYRAAAQEIQMSIRKIIALEMAANITEQAFGWGKRL